MDNMSALEQALDILPTTVTVGLPTITKLSLVDIPHSSCNAAVHKRRAGI